MRNEQPHNNIQNTCPDTALGQVVTAIAKNVLIAMNTTPFPYQEAIKIMEDPHKDPSKTEQILYSSFIPPHL